jgi:hypothetical protein
MKDPVERLGAVWSGFDLAARRPGVAAWDVSLPSAFPNTAGIALLLDVLEHLNNPWLAMTNIAGLVMRGGYLVVTLPNPRWSRSRLNALLTGFPCSFTQGDLDGNHHVFPPWPHIVERLLTDVGMKVLRYVTLDGRTAWPGPPYVTPRIPVRFAVVAACKLIERSDPSACGMSYGVLAQKGNA